MVLLGRRTWWVGLVGVFAAGATEFACSSSPANGDGGTDASTDSTTDVGSQRDAGPDVQVFACDANIPGTCNIVAQNCPSGQECKAIQPDGGVWMLECKPNTTGSLQEGYQCTGGGASNPCVVGLECISGRCAKHCCSGSDSMCGSSQPENFPGKCNLDVTLDGTNTAYTVCNYAPGCEPFGIQPCGSGQTCLVQDMNGTATCSMLNNNPKNEKEGCTYANDCAPGLGCYGAPDGGGYTCQWNCFSPPGPFDAGIAQREAGMGGCPAGETCKGYVQSLPMWYGICE